MLQIGVSLRFIFWLHSQLQLSDEEMYLEPGDVFIGPTATNYVTKKKISKFEKKRNYENSG